MQDEQGVLQARARAGERGLRRACVLEQGSARSGCAVARWVGWGGADVRRLELCARHTTSLSEEVYGEI